MKPFDFNEADSIMYPEMKQDEEPHEEPEDQSQWDEKYAGYEDEAEEKLGWTEEEYKGEGNPLN